jgi:hypothetical protein
MTNKLIGIQKEAELRVPFRNLLLGPEENDVEAQ